MNQQVTRYIDAAAQPQREAMIRLRQLIHSCLPGVEEEFKWGRPVFRTTRDIVYFKTTKANLSMGFFDASGFEDPNGLLEGTGKAMRHLKIPNAEAVDEVLLTTWLQIASTHP